MRRALSVACLTLSVSVAEAGQAGRASAASPAPDRVAEAYEQFLRAHLLENEDVDQAIAAYRQAMTLDPLADEIPADLADLYLREGRVEEAMAAANESIKLASANRQAHRVLGTIYAQLAGRRPTQSENIGKAIEHFEQAIEPPIASADANLRAMLARLYVANENYDKAIPLLADLVRQEPDWPEGPSLLAEAYTESGRSAEAVSWLEEVVPGNPQLYPTLADFYGRARRWSESAAAYQQALRVFPRRVDLRIQMAASLLATGTRTDLVRARDALREAVSMSGSNERALYLLSQAERRAGDAVAAEGAARRLITQNGRNPRGYSALAEALEGQRRYQPIVDALEPAVGTFRASEDGAFALSLLLPHLGFAYQKLEQYPKAIAAFEEAKAILPDDPSMTSYLVQAHLAARNFVAAADVARQARTRNPTDLRLAQLEFLALRRGGKVDEGLAVLEDLLKAHADDVEMHLALAQGYVEANRGAGAVKVLQDAQKRFPDEAAIQFELGSVYDKQKKFAESEAIFKRLIEKEPDNAQALNYLGYMLAERGQRLGESVGYLKRALAIDPDNGSYLDSIGWAYYKDGKLDLAVQNLERAAGLLDENSVVQDHYGDVLFKLGRFSDAIDAWNRALSGDEESIDRNAIDKKIRAARQKLPKR